MIIRTFFRFSKTKIRWSNFNFRWSNISDDPTSDDVFSFSDDVFETSDDSFYVSDDLFLSERVFWKLVQKHKKLEKRKFLSRFSIINPTNCVIITHLIDEAYFAKRQSNTHIPFLLLRVMIVLWCQHEPILHVRQNCTMMSKYWYQTLK